MEKVWVVFGEWGRACLTGRNGAGRAPRLGKSSALPAPLCLIYGPGPLPFYCFLGQRGPAVYLVEP